MPRYIITMSRVDRRTAIVEAPNRQAAEEAARVEFEWADADELNEHGAITIVNVTIEED